MGYRRVRDHGGNEGQAARRNHPGVGTVRCTDTETKAREKERETKTEKSRQMRGKETAAKRR